MSVLCIDVGNSRLKWGVRNPRGWQSRSACQLAEFVLPDGIERIVACNVAGAQAQRTLEQRAAARGLSIEWLTARSAQCGVVNGYDRPGQLGADRWAALIGARALHGGDGLAVMCGTATTVDVLDAQGVFRGGLILPGLGLMRRALAAGAADLPGGVGEYCDLPTNTLAAIASGGLNATVGAIERMFRHIACGHAPLCLISGGSAAGVAERLAVPHRVVHNLVLEGLAIIAERGTPGDA